jgi:hypothetical protein
VRDLVVDPFIRPQDSEAHRGPREEEQPEPHAAALAERGKGIMPLLRVLLLATLATILVVTGAAARSVGLLPETARLLRQIQPLRVTPDTCVFASTTGTPLEPKSHTKRPLTRATHLLRARRSETNLPCRDLSLHT